MKKLLSALAMVAIFACGCSLGGGNVIMKVNGEPITKQQFDEVFNELIGSSPFFGGDKKQAGMDKDNMLYGIFRDKAVNELAYNTLLNQEIKRRNIIVTNDDYEKEVENLINTLGSKEELNKFLKQRGITPARFKKATYEHLKMQKLADSISKSDVTEEEISNYYKKRIHAFSYPEKVRASHILILANEDEYKAVLAKKHPSLSEDEINNRAAAEMEKKKAAAEEILAQVKKSPNDFAKIAKNKSDDRISAKQGGELGFFARKEMIKEFSDTAFSLPINHISDLVKTKYGYHIIIVTDRMEAGTYPFEKVKNEIKQTIKTNKQMSIINGLASALKNNANIEIVDKEYETSELQRLIDEETAQYENENNQEQ